MKAESAPVSPEGTGTPGASISGSEKASRQRLRRLRAAVRFDGLCWRKLARLGCVHGPEWWRRLSPPAVALVIFLLVGRNRRATVENQARVLGPGSSRWRALLAAYRSFATFARCVAETMEFYGPHPRTVRIDEPVNSHVAAALARGHGVIVATAHLGNWDISGSRLQATGHPVHLVMAREPNETMQEYARQSREHVGVRVLYSDSSVFSSFNMIRALRRNEILAMQIDRGTGAGNGSVKAVDFFGEPAPFQEGPFQLARLSGAPVVPVLTLRRGRRHYEVVLGKPRRVARHVPGDAARALRETVRFFERAIREHPEQWFQFTPFWPPGPGAP